MTRKTIFRLTLALLLLPNFSAYWWMLPRRMKRCRTYRDAFMQTAMRHSAKFIQRQWERAFELSLLMRNRIETAPITEREFRLPFQVTANPVVMFEEFAEVTPEMWERLKSVSRDGQPSEPPAIRRER